jgi:hypothetical protein
MRWVAGGKGVCQVELSFIHSFTYSFFTPLIQELLKLPALTVLDP